MNPFAALQVPTRLFLSGIAIVALMAGTSALGVGLAGQIAAALIITAVLTFIGRHDRAAELDREIDDLRRTLDIQTQARDDAAETAARLQTALDAAQTASRASHSNQQLVNSSAAAEVTALLRGALRGNLIDRAVLAGQPGDLDALAGSLNELLDGMAATVSEIQQVSLEVTRGAQEIAANNATLSQRTGEQAASLEETASSMEQMTATVKQNAANAGQANQLAMAARGQAESGGAVVGKAIGAMSEINSSSKRIADIIGVIDEIAFQTNLLALNAAVEAARAGEQGRGFAVVASEVRSLAGRSATAAKEIKALIQDSVRKVEDGSRLVTDSGHTLEQIVVSVKKVSDIVAEIAAASREQSSGIEQVNRAIMQMDELTQQNAGLVEEATAASRTVASQVRGLSRIVGKYQIPNAAPQGAPTTAARSLSGDSPGNSDKGSRGTERRNSDRPWAGSATPGAEDRGDPILPRTGTGDSAWQEF